MLIVGELINSSRKAIAQIIEQGDAAALQKVATEQVQSGAHYLDVNAGTFFEHEPEYLKWLVQNVQAAVEAPCCIDSPSPQAIEAALAVHRGTPMINSISMEKERLERLMPIIAGTDFKVVALCMSDAGMPVTVDDRMAIAEKLVEALVQNNLKLENIYIDPLVQPVSVDDRYGVAFLASIQKIMAAFPGIHTVCGLSNISYGLPNRRYLNQVFMIMAILSGLDGAIVNPSDRQMMAAIVAAEAMAGKDEYMGRYLKAHRAGLFAE